MSNARKIVITLVAVAVLGVGGVFAWILFIRDDAPPALTTTDLDEALDGTAVDTSTAATGDTSATATSGTTGEAVTAAGDVSGEWTISSDSTLGYRVQEVLGGVDGDAAGRTNDVSGTLTIAGTAATAAEFTVQMASITSDSSRRDGQFNGRIMSTDAFPTATFVLTEPIDFGALPAEGQTITASATGDLTLRGVTRRVTFGLEAKIEATAGSSRIGVLGSIPILFSDFDIPDPSNGFAVVKDGGLLEFVLVFDEA